MTSQKRRFDSFLDHMNLMFKKLVDEHLRVKKLYGKDSKEEQEALAKAKKWQDACRHKFTKMGRHGLMCCKCNYPDRN